MDDVFPRVRRYRLALATEVESLSDADMEAASWCEGWRVRDVVGHLVHLAEGTNRSVFVDVARNGVVPDKGLARVARTIGAQSQGELAERLRAAADGRFHILGSPKSVALGEVLVHSQDALRPIGRALEPEPDDVLPNLAVYRRLGRVVFHRKRPSVHLVADDVEWEAGSGPEVRGKAIDLLLLLANRRQVVPQLSGEGVASLG